MKVIRRNAIRCLNCGDIIESKYTHDFKWCKCHSCFVDGGHEYIRIGGDENEIEVLSEYEDVPSYWVEMVTHYGGKRVFEIEQSKANEMIEFYEGQWDYLRITDDDGNEIYKTKGYDRFDYS